MSSTPLSEKTTAGATVVPILDTTVTKPENVKTSPALSRSTTREAEDDFDPSFLAKPCSPFYKHPSIRSSQDASRSNSRINLSRLSMTGNEAVDLETGLATRSTNDVTKSGAVLTMTTTTRSKPGFKLKSRSNGGWKCLRGLTKKQRFTVKVCIAVFAVGCMVAIALGISKAVGGGVWKSSGQTASIGSP